MHIPWTSSTLTCYQHTRLGQELPLYSEEHQLPFSLLGIHQYPQDPGK